MLSPFPNFLRKRMVARSSVLERRDECFAAFTLIKGLKSLDHFEVRL